MALWRKHVDEPLLIAAVANGGAGGVDASAQGRLRDDPALPDGGQEIILGHDVLAVAD